MSSQLPVPRVVNAGGTVSIKLYGGPTGATINAAATAVSAGFPCFGNWAVASATGSGPLRTLTFTVPPGTPPFPCDLSVNGAFTSGGTFATSSSVPLTVADPLTPPVQLSFSSPANMSPSGTFTITATGIPAGQPITAASVGLFSLSGGQFGATVSGISPLAGDQQTLTVQTVGLLAQTTYEIDVTGTLNGSNFVGIAPAPRISTANTILYSDAVPAAGLPGGTFTVTGTNFPPGGVTTPEDVTVSMFLPSLGEFGALEVIDISPGSGATRTITFRVPYILNLSAGLTAVPAGEFELTPLVTVDGTTLYQPAVYLPLLRINGGSTSFVSLANPVSADRTVAQPFFFTTRYEITVTGFPNDTFEVAGIGITLANANVAATAVAITPAAGSGTRIITFDLGGAWTSGGQTALSLQAVSTTGNRVQSTAAATLRYPFVVTFQTPVPVPGQPGHFTISSTNFPVAETLAAGKIEVIAQNGPTGYVMQVNSITPAVGSAARTIAFVVPVPAIVPAGNYSVSVKGLTASQAAVMTEFPQPLLTWNPGAVSYPITLSGLTPLSGQAGTTAFTVSGTGFPATGAVTAAVLRGTSPAVTFLLDPVPNNGTVRLLTFRIVTGTAPGTYTLDLTGTAADGGAITTAAGVPLIVQQEQLTFLPPGRNIAMARFTVGGDDLVLSCIS